MFARFIRSISASAFAAVAASAGELSWSLQPLERPVPPALGFASPIDNFVAARLAASGLELSPPADRAIWLRRIYFNLIGLPPSSDDLAAFLADEAPGSDERVVDRLLASARYGERWARHWMDVARYAETHGHDEDAIRENAWPYRDWLIRAFNDDMPYSEFIRAQVAGDVLIGDATVATGFLACGPWDSSSQQGIQDGVIDKKIAQYLDRDDMLSATMSTFTSTTVHCARCHDHKFDPVSLEDYYALQAVFAGVDKVDRPYGPELPSAEWIVMPPSAIASASGSPYEIFPDGRVIFQGIAPETDTTTITGSSSLPQLTGIQLEVLPDPSLPAGGPGRAPNGNFHLSEIKVRIDGQPVTLANAAADFDQDGWDIHKSLDGDPASAWGIHPAEGSAHRAVFTFAATVATSGSARIEVELAQLHGESHVIGHLRVSLTSNGNPGAGLGLSDRPMVYAVASDFAPAGNFKPAGQPREIHVLDHGDALTPLEIATPGALSCIPGLPARFELEHPGDEGARRLALADWIAHPDNVLTWRSIANRIWHYHFGRGLVGTPNDFGKMGDPPTHPELLDWLAMIFRDGGGSFKKLHKAIVLSDTYRQASDERSDGLAADIGNRLLWRMNRQRLDGECLHDAVLTMSGMLDLTMGGPSARQFHASKGVHVTPVLDYLGFDPDDPANFRRSVYRFVFRTVPDPLMQALDCPDASQLVPNRETSSTSLQALALLNNRFLIRQAEHLAADLARHSDDLDSQVNALFLRAYARPAPEDERSKVAAYARRHGLANACRIVLNSSEFLYVQ